MTNRKKTLIGPNASIDESIENVDVSLLQINSVVDDDRRLFGVATDDGPA